jgi:hypothetical protein
MSKIKQEELELITSQHKESTSLINQLGWLEAKKHELLHTFAKLNADMSDAKKDLEAAYGQVNINLETGEYTELEDEQSN